ncbi:MAG TPA: hypothetical protein VJU77_15340 [Chthoniobacterales bacterium]|nr:hypothetical protein [Chthoniobacterales bacterium]
MLARFLVFFASVAIAKAADDLPGHVTILPTSEGPKIIKQCSRTDPAEVTGFWLPLPADVAASEKTLPQLLRKSGHTINLGHSYRQYIGIVSHGKKLIYVNAFSETVLVHPPLRRSWKREAMVICDGGDVFWGVEFDPATRVFTHLEFNGSI